MNEKDEDNRNGSKETKHTDQQPVARNGVFLMRAEGQSFEEFKEFCIKRFKEAGLIKEKT